MNASHLTRRQLLARSAAGLSASGWLPILARHAAAAEGAKKHKSCILLYMSGGPSHIDTFDLKLTGDTRTEFQPIATSVPGIQISEHLPGVARLMHHAAVIRGMSTAEADHELDRFIDEAYMSSLGRVRIIHGFGTGALQRFVHHFLRDHDLIERFQFAPDTQGGNGATIAELKQ